MKEKNCLSIFAIIIAHIAVIIAIISLKIENVGEANYIAIAATFLTGAVTFAVGYNIYINLKVTKSVAREAAIKVAMEQSLIITNRLADETTKNSNVIFAYATGSGNYAMATSYFVNNDFDNARRCIIEARNNFITSNHQENIEHCNNFILEIEREQERRRNEPNI